MWGRDPRLPATSLTLSLARFLFRVPGMRQSHRRTQGPPQRRGTCREMGGAGPVRALAVVWELSLGTSAEI